MAATETIGVAALEDVLRRALVASRTSEVNAASVARALAAAEVDGQKGHGLSRIASYSAQSRSGKVDGFAVAVVAQTRPSALMIDVKGGFAYPAFDLAIGQLPVLARANGIAAAGFVRSHHAGVVGRHVERLAEQGLVALAFANTPGAMAAWGGRKAVFGTNPIGFAAPRVGDAPLVIDMALSAVARGKILTAAQKGEDIPEGWAVDADGRPTTDAKAALKGTLTPAGGAKGAALAMMVELLAVALTGANLASEATSFFDGEGPPPGVGQFVLAIDPAAFGGGQTFADRFASLVDLIEGDGSARLPGTRRLALRAKAAHEGVVVDAGQLAEARKLAGAVA